MVIGGATSVVILLGGELPTYMGTLFALGAVLYFGAVLNGD